MEKKNIVLKEQPNFQEDYTHSSNSLFHFMKKPDYLYDAFKSKALMPRYCKENIEYLGLSLNDVPFNEMAVLMKCFCDIPLHRITQYSESIKLSNKKKSKKQIVQYEYSHTSIYGEYAIAFSKSWGEQHGIQPITYLNTSSKYLSELCKAINYAISGEVEIPDIIANNYLIQLAFFKPLRGSMLRDDGGKASSVEKNFFDEQEWRFIPSISFQDDEFFPVIANPLILSNMSQLSDNPMHLLSKRLCDCKYKEYWLNFVYDDVRYIIVPNKQSRLDFIDYIIEMPDAYFSTIMEKYILISKILVLEEIRKDW